jgi:hypothetical protein
MFRRLSTRARIALVAVVGVLMGAAGVGVALTAAASGPVLSTTERGLCIRSGTGEPRSLWLVAATHRCPDPYWGPTNLKDAFGIESTGTAGPAGPVGPAGPKGDPGDSRLMFSSGQVTVKAGEAGNGIHVVTVTGMPPFSTTQVKRTLVDFDGEALPPGVIATVNAPTAVAKSTSWNYTVTTSGAAIATPSYILRLDVIAAPVTP